MRFLGQPYKEWAGCDDPTGILTPGEIYECRVEHHSWHTRIYIEERKVAGIPLKMPRDRYYNSVNFEEVVIVTSSRNNDHK